MNVLKWVWYVLLSILGLAVLIGGSIIFAAIGIVVVTIGFIWFGAFLCKLYFERERGPP